MRISAALIIVGSIIVSAPVMAKHPVKGSEEQSPQDVTVTSVQVVDVEDLPSDLSDQIDEHEAASTEEEMQSLRDSISATPQAVAALEKKGRTAAQVVAITVDENGFLTIFTRRDD